MQVLVLQQQLDAYLGQHAGMHAGALDRVVFVEESVAKSGYRLGLVESCSVELVQSVKGVRLCLDEDVKNSKQIREVLNREMADTRPQLKQACMKEEMTWTADAIEQLSVGYVAAVRESRDEATGRQVMLWELEQLRAELREWEEGDFKFVSDQVSKLGQVFGQLQVDTLEQGQGIIKMQAAVAVLSSRVIPLDTAGLLGRLSQLECRRADFSQDYSGRLAELDKFNAQLVKVVGKVDIRIKAMEVYGQDTATTLRELVDCVKFFHEEQKLLCDRRHSLTFYIALMSKCVEFRSAEDKATLREELTSATSTYCVGDILGDVFLRERLKGIRAEFRSRRGTTSRSQSCGREQESRVSLARSRRSVSKGR